MSHHGGLHSGCPFQSLILSTCSHAHVHTHSGNVIPTSMFPEVLCDVRGVQHLPQDLYVVEIDSECCEVPRTLHASLLAFMIHLK